MSQAVPNLAAEANESSVDSVANHKTTAPISLDNFRGWALFVERVAISYARRHQLVGLLDEQGQTWLVLGVRNVLPHPESGHSEAQPVRASRSQHEALDAVRRWLNKPVRIARADSDQVAGCINRVYEGQTGHADQAIRGIEAEDDISTLLDQDHTNVTSGGGGGDLLDGEGRAPVVKLANALLFEAVKLQASDVHVQPREDRVAVRMRIDGVLFDAYVLPISTHEELVSRIKVMGRMNIAEKRIPQDGRATVRVGTRTIDLRLSTVPTSYGERVVFRLLDKSARLYTLDDLGMPPEVLEQFGEIITAEHGLVLVTGPTGSGKSTTLYGALQQINCTELNVLTLEDPIEYQLPGVSQMQVSDKKGMNFARGLRSVLRQDPDIIMVGEIRDKETAELAIQAALTGHLVFSTLHTNDAPSAVTRLLDLGIEPYLVSSSLLAVMAQRLVRRVCGECAHPLDATTTREQLARLDIPAYELSQHKATEGFRGRRGDGCPACRDTGYRGRVGLYEYLPINEPLRESIQQRASASTLKQIARHHGMQSLRDDGVQKFLHGRTTVDEILRVTPAPAPAPGSISGSCATETSQDENPGPEESLPRSRSAIDSSISMTDGGVG